ncbi:MAG: DUF523 domain-containing protein [Negativicutes bacterium]|nr:DUF523 domain-containing protein [Negativicutes bacterium]
MIIISTCLLGIYSKYDGGSNLQPLLAKYSHRGRFIPLCPEQLGGLPTPRQPAEIDCGCGSDVLEGKAKVMDKSGVDRSSWFVKGAQEVAAIVHSFPVTAAILKERSPSCGVHLIYDGSFGHVVKSGQGVTATLLKQLGIPLYSETDITEELLLELLTK